MHFYIRTWPAAMAALGLMASSAHAGELASSATRYPVKPVRVLVGFAPGGAVDVQARIVAQSLSELLGQTVLIDNRGGQDGIIAGNAVAKSAPDGHTLVYVSAGHAMNSVLHAKTIPYHPLRDFAPISLTASGPLTLVVNPSLPVADLKGLVALARKRPGQLNFASSGTGGTMHLAGELLKSMAAIDIVHVPYKGGGPAITDVLGGQVELTFVGAPASMPHIQAGRLKVLAVTTPKRAVAFPNVPTVAEMGYPGYEVGAWYGVLAPAGTPAAIVERLSGDLAKTVNAPKIRERLLQLGIEPVGSTPKQFAAHIGTEIARWTPIIEKAGIKTD
jgi:tripartite-type tricarboxylate transporter receptor subunit TctC